MRALVGVTGMAGHALPAIALAAELSSRGHDVLVHTTERWRGQVEAAGARFAGTETEIIEVVPAADGPPGHAAIASALAASIEEFGADVVVGDALTLTPGLAAEVTGVRSVTLFPEVYPFSAPGMPYFSLGLLPPRTAAGALAWRALAPLLEMRLPTTGWLRGSREALNAERAKLGLAPLEGRHGPVSGGMTLVATLPGLEFPRTWAADVHVTGPMIVDLPGPTLEIPAGAEPLVVIAPSTVKDPERALVSTALEALAGEPVRVIASTSGAPAPTETPGNAIVAEWIDYARVMHEAALVISNGTHGTIVKALSEGVPLLVAPAMPDDAEHGARVAWSGAGLCLTRRRHSPRVIRLLARRLLGDPQFARRARQIADSMPAGGGAARGADLIEDFAR